MSAPTYLINIADLTAVPALLCGMFLAPLLDRSAIINAEPGRFDGIAALIKPEIEQARMAAAITVLRRQGFGTADLRVYVQRGATWHRLNDAELAALLPAVPQE